MASKNNEKDVLLSETALEKGISNDALIQALEKAVEKAALRSFGNDYTFISQYDPQSKRIKLFNQVTVVSDEYADSFSGDKKYISRFDALSEYELGDLINAAEELALQVFQSQSYEPKKVSDKLTYATYQESVFEFAEFINKNSPNQSVINISYAIVIGGELELFKPIDELTQEEFFDLLEIKINFPVYYHPTEVASSKYSRIKKRFGDLIPNSAQKYDRIIAQYAKHVLGETLRENERERIAKEFQVKIGQIVKGTIRITNHRGYNKSDRQDYYVDIDGTEAILPYREQVPGEFLPYGQEIRMLLLNVVTAEQKAPQIIVSRRSEDFIIKLLEEQVTEIFEGDVVIKGVAREAGVRTKIAVTSKDRNIDPIGACLGHQGSHIRPVLEEISRYMPKGNEREKEKIEIILYKEDPAKFVKNAIQPSILDDNRYNVISRYYINNDENKMILVIPERYLKQMIGKKGQNVRLASRLTGWNIDIYSEEKYMEKENELKEALCQQPGIHPEHIEELWDLRIIDDANGYEETFRDLGNIVSLEGEELAGYIGISLEDAQHIIATAQRLLDEPKAKESTKESSEDRNENDE